MTTKIKDKRDAILLSREYSNAINAWKSKINQIVMTKEEGKRRKAELKIAGYCNSILDMNEDKLADVLDFFKQRLYNVTLFVSDKKVEVMDMPRLVLEIK